MKKIIILVLTVLLTGCYNYVEINDLELINGIHIDYQNNKYIIKFDTNKIIESEGTTLSDAFRNFEETIPKKAFYAHLKVLIISEEVLNNHFNELVDFILRNNEIRNNFYLLISNDIEKFNSSKIRNIIKNKKFDNNIVKNCTFKHVVTTYLKNNVSLLPLMNKDLKIIGSIAKDKYNTLKFNLDETRLLGILLNKHPNILYKNINIYNSEVKYKENTIKIYLDAELNEKDKIDHKKHLEKDIKYLLKRIKKNNINVLNMNDKYFKNNENYNIKIILDINRNGQLINEKQK